MRVAIRVDASADIGTGHVKRCLSLAEALASIGAEVRFICRDHGLSYESMFAGRPEPLVLLAPPAPGWTRTDGDPAHAGWAGLTAEADAAETVAVLENWVPDWIVLDHYGFDRRWHDTVRDALGCKLAQIDDLGDRPLAVDLLVDHNPAPDHRAKYAASGPMLGRLLGGPRYALLAPAYRDLAVPETAQSVRSIGIFLGGVDLDNRTPGVLAACRAAGFDGPVAIVSTSANPHLAALESAIAVDGNAILLTDLPDLVSFFLAHDIQIGAGGGATWERCRAGAAAIVLSTAGNQRIVVDGLIAAEAAVGLYAGEVGALPDAIRRLLGDRALRARLSANAAQLVDGRGCERVALAMAAERIAVRPATMSDAQKILVWRNHPETRAMSIDSSEIDLHSHLAWFERSLAMQGDRRIFIGTIGVVDVGVVRFDRSDAGEWTVSIFLDPGLPGLGLGTRLLRAGEEAMLAAAGPQIRFHAETLPGNLASRTMFLSCGYRGDVNFVKDAGTDSASNERSGNG